MRFQLRLIAFGVVLLTGCSQSPAGLVLGAQSGSVKIQPSSAHDHVLQRWLRNHPELRLAQLEDCEDRWTDSKGKEHVESCQRLVQQLREWTKDSAANPLYVRGDFNADRQEDFAVVLTDTRARDTREKPATVVVFNGPFQSADVIEHAFLLPGRVVSQTFLGYGAPRPKPWRLIIGAPESEGRALVWRDGKYRLG